MISSSTRKHQSYKVRLKTHRIGIAIFYKPYSDISPNKPHISISYSFLDKGAEGARGEAPSPL